MKANTKKTMLLCISDAISFEAGAEILAESGDKLTSVDELCLLGFRFGRRPNCDVHVQSIRRSLRGRYWLLIHLKQHHLTERDLVTAYKAIKRPLAEYCSVVFHLMLTDQQDEQLERLQSTALRYIYGFGLSYAAMREMADISTLRSRHIEACDKFAASCLRSPRFSGWFPEARQVRDSRHALVYKEEFARCDRLRNSPLHYMRRRLNGKAGKEYGKRNAKYRDA